MTVLKITWKLEDEITLEKAGLPEFYNVPLDKREWSVSKIKRFLENTYYYRITNIEVFY